MDKLAPTLTHVLTVCSFRSPSDLRATIWSHACLLSRSLPSSAVRRFHRSLSSPPVPFLVLHLAAGVSQWAAASLLRVDPLRVLDYYGWMEICHRLIPPVLGSSPAVPFESPMTESLVWAPERQDLLQIVQIVWVIKIGEVNGNSKPYLPKEFKDGVDFVPFWHVNMITEEINRAQRELYIHQ